MAGRNGWPPSENDPATPMLIYRSSVADGPSGETDYKQQMEEKPRSQIEVRILVCSVSKTNSALPIKMSENL